MDAWAQRTDGHPVPCFICGRMIPPGELYYYVTAYDRIDGREPPVCYLHVDGAKKVNHRDLADY